MVKNKFSLTMESRSSNESFIRATISAFALQLDPTLEEISDIKTAVSEAVSQRIGSAAPKFSAGNAKDAFLDGLFD